MERARAFAPPAGRSRGECGSGIALTRSPARPKIGAVHRGGGETSGSSSLGKQDRRAGDEIVPMHPRWERILRGESAYARFQRMYRTAFALVPSPWRCKFYDAPFKGPVAGTLKWWSGAHPPARARSASLSRFGGSATRVLRQGPVERNRVTRAPARTSAVLVQGPDTGVDAEPAVAAPLVRVDIAVVSAGLSRRASGDDGGVAVDVHRHLIDGE
jgi:hypothetical protein